MPRLSITIAALAAGVLLAAAAHAITPADKCEADKLKRAGKYNFCRLKADAKAIKTASAPDYTLCNLKLSEKWNHAETVGGGQCPTNGDLVPMQARITADANDVVACLNGTCPQSCGDGIANGVESCDGADLAGETCATLGFASGALACTAGCGFDVSGCQSQAFLATGQTTAYGAGSDGDVEAGAALAYTDNGDGTISDENTGLMWEKKDNAGGIHDLDNVYTWCADVSPANGICDGGTDIMDGTIKTSFLDTLNDVSGGGANCFAGYCDWRIPNLRELESLVNFGVFSPAVSAVFNTACAPACTVLTCSCTNASADHWTSTTMSLFGPITAWNVHFYVGVHAATSKNSSLPVRAVRGGS